MPCSTHRYEYAWYCVLSLKWQTWYVHHPVFFVTHSLRSAWIAAVTADDADFYAATRRFMGVRMRALAAEMGEAQKIET